MNTPLYHILMTPTHSMLDHYLRELQAKPLLTIHRQDALEHLPKESYAVEVCGEWESYIQRMLLTEDLNKKTFCLLLYMQRNAGYATQLLDHETDFTKIRFTAALDRYVDSAVYGVQLNGATYEEVLDDDSRNTSVIVCQLRSFYALL